MPPKKNQKKGSQQTSKAGSKLASKAGSRQDTPQPGTPVAEPEVPIGTAVIGINFGQTASSIALINKEGRADCIANDDGDRQIATAISFVGDQIYVGNPARAQLVRNNANTILGFRDLLGKSYDEVRSTPVLFNSAHIINKDGHPAFTVTTSDAETTFTASEVATRYISTLLSYASDFAGRKIDAAVFAVPDTFSSAQTSALAEAARAAGVQSLQFVTEAGAAAVAYGLSGSNAVVLDVGGTSATATVLAARGGAYVPLATVREEAIGGDELDSRLIEFFGKEFTKKTKVTLDGGNHRAMIKLRLAAEITKRSLSASNTANCSVESLAEGMDFSGSVNRMRFDLLASKVYSGIVKVVEQAVEKSGLSKEAIHEVVLIGGSTKLPAIGDRVAGSLHSSVKVTNSIETDEAVAIGCALQARQTIDAYPLDSDLFASEYTASLTSDSVLSAPVLSKPLGLLVNAPKDAPQAVDGKLFVTLADSYTPLPLRLTFELPVTKNGGGRVYADLWEGQHEVRVEELHPKPNGEPTGGEGTDEEDEEEEPIRTALVKPIKAIAHLALPDSASGGKKVVLTLKVDEQGKGSLVAAVGDNEAKAEF